MPHSIRLRGPWEYQPLARLLPVASGHLQMVTDNLPPGGTLDLPADWGEALGRDFQGVVRFSRRFHRPTGLDAASRVWLVVEDVDSQANIELNDCFLGAVIGSGSTFGPDEMPCCPARFDITANLQPQNRLSISVTSPSLGPRDGMPLTRPGREHQPGGLIGLVRLEIE
jgi:hypothetical protein